MKRVDPAGFKVTRVNLCASPHCKASATSVVTNADNQYPVKVCLRHVGWAKQRVKEIENS